MTTRFDRVVRKGYEDDTLVYSLVLDEYGLYIVRTGNVSGLDNGSATLDSDDALAPTFVRQLANQEERLDQEPLPVLVHGEHSLYVPLQQITAVQVDTEAEPRTLSLDTLNDHYEFSLTQAASEDVDAFADALRARLSAR
jgi:hypothetical protein